MAQGLAQSRTITALLAAVGAGFAVSAMIGAPDAVAQSCRPDQVWLHGECTYPAGDSAGPPPEPRLNVHGPCLPVMGFEDACCSPGPTIPCA
jgi:hypothetical protein